jgi:putative phage-type endonuclease
MIYIQTATNCVDDINTEDELYDNNFDRLMHIENSLEIQKEDILNYLYDVCIEFINTHTISICEENFSEILYENMNAMLFCAIENQYELEENLYDILKSPDIFINKAIKFVHTKYIPSRSYKSTFIRSNVNIDKTVLSEKIRRCDSVIQPDQRTKEWYEFRHGIITASSAWKVFDSQSVLNSLIYEKCKPYVIKTSSGDFINTESPLHWGQKYEPLSVMIYEAQYKTKIGEYGCIPHEKFTYIGASPDGINIDPLSERYGRMLEIKNIVNREITQIPKKEYWIQMQLQMEVCNLNECDFLETRFVEYDNENEFMLDGSNTETSDGKMKGIILLFYKENKPLYEYYQHSIHGNFEMWEKKMFASHEGNMFMRTIYWKLDEISCILVLRNKQWFEKAVIEMGKTWDIIKHEKVHGYEHRAPKKRVRKSSFDISGNKCYINLSSKLSNNVNNEGILFDTIDDNDNKNVDL